MKARGGVKAVNPAQLQAGIRLEISKKVRKSYAQTEVSIGDTARGMVRRHLLASGAVQSLLSGKLQSDFGLDSAGANRTVNQIIEYISNNIMVSFVSTPKSDSVATFTLDLLPMGVRGLAALPAGQYTSTGKFGGGDVSWLTWLLTKGTQVVIGDFYVFDDPKGSSRAGSVMQKTGKNHPEGFRVDPGFSGTERDNFVTRALAPIIPKIRNTIFQKIKEGLK